VACLHLSEHGKTLRPFPSLSQPFLDSIYCVGSPACQHSPDSGFKHHLPVLGASFESVPIIWERSDVLLLSPRFPLPAYPLPISKGPSCSVRPLTKSQFDALCVSPFVSFGSLQDVSWWGCLIESTSFFFFNLKLSPPALLFLGLFLFFASRVFFFQVSFPSSCP